jgi:hypothetical protein
VLESLKKLFARKSRGVEVEYERPSGDEPAAMPVGPPTSGITPAAPVDRPADDSEQR